ncbi:hypothetical protein FSP39_002113 [Pinctada imbricata]|uniref:Uncharacterized protein n=1 Tax=Pinctada imbricata TaxID=66713 RepID=A0AA88YCF9_PINIB|nr:hypothetical protein FSP39_002113 [Pinctada imbricata]
MTDEVKYVVAFDIGTTYSGYAYQDSKESQRDPLSIVTNSWQGGTTLSMKTPTAILFDKEKNFHSFGNDAAKAYANALETGAQHDYIFVKGFKMKLYHEEKVSDTLFLKDTEDRDIDGMLVFTELIKSLKKDAMADMAKRLGEFDKDKVTFVLTVPAIWREPAKQFMRLAAEKAEIKPENLILALEPEAAALYCKNLELNSALGSGDGAVKSCFQPGGKYMIMDLGGGTVDSVVHATNENSDVIELYKSSGGPWGGEYVNVNFMTYLETTYGEDAAKRFKETRCLDHYELEQEFEEKKRKLNTANEVDVRLRIPGHLKTLASKPIDKHTVDHLYIKKTEFKSFFDPLIEQIIQHLKSIFSEVGEIPLLFLVGGFSESAYLQEKLREEFTNTKIVVP